MEREQARQEIRQRWREIIPEYASTAKKKVNGEKSYICPFCGHGKGGDGLTLNTKSKDRNGLKCFGCDFSGDILDLIQRKTGADHNTALKMAADTLGITIDPQGGDRVKDRQERFKAALKDFKPADTEKPAEAAKTPEKGAQEATETAAADYMPYYKRCKARLDDPAAISYLQARGISRETAAACWIGFDPAADPANCPGAEDGERKRHPEARIIIPVTRGHYIGRAISPDASLIKANSKGSTTGIFNWRFLTKDGMDTIFVLEGAFDALSVQEVGAAAIALNSTSNVDALLKQLEQTPTTATLVLCMDNDNAGAEARQRLSEGLQRLNIPFIVANIAGSYKDANEALTADREAFAAAVKAAEDAAEKKRNGDYLTDFLEKIQTEAYRPYITGLSFFDDLLGGGVIQQSLLLLMAAPGTGKTTLCQQIAEEMAIRKKPVIYLNLEMSREQMFAKAISCRLARKNGAIQKTALDVLQGYKWSAEDREAITAAVDEYREKVYPYIQYNPGEIGSDLDAILQYLQQIGEKAKAEGKQAPAVIVDYLHLISSKRGLDVQELIKQAVTGLKDYAKSYDTFVIGIVATNRVTNISGKITMESGRDSSNLEYTGDYQLSLNYYEIDNGDIKPTEVDKIAQLQQMKWRHMILRVLKGRFCMPGRSAKVYFNAASNIFYGENDFMPADDERTPFGSYQQLDWDSEIEEPKEKKRKRL